MKNSWKSVLLIIAGVICLILLSVMVLQYPGNHAIDLEEFLDNNFTADRFDLPDGEYIDTVEASMDVRYVYYGVPEEMEGTLYTVLKDGTISSDSTFYPDKTIQQTVEDLESSMENWFFWIIWILLTGWLIVGFCRMENRWLK